MQTQTKSVLDSAIASVKGGLLTRAPAASVPPGHTKSVSGVSWAIPGEGRGCLLFEKVHLKKRCLVWKVRSMKWRHSNVTGGKSVQQPPLSCPFHTWVKSCPGDTQGSRWLHNGKCIAYLELTWLYLEWFNTVVIKNFVFGRSNINRWNTVTLFFDALFCPFWQVSAQGRTQRA